MSRIVRQLLVASTLALYGSVSLCGAGLHALLHPSCADRDRDPHDGKPTKHLTCGTSTDNCSICHQAVQGQMPVAAPPLPDRPLVQFRTPTLHRVVTCLDRYSSSRPRAPPPIPTHIS